MATFFAALVGEMKYLRAYVTEMVAPDNYSQGRVGS